MLNRKQGLDEQVKQVTIESKRVGEMIKVVDDKNLAPDGFARELSKCFALLPFKLDEEIPVYVEEQNTETDGSAWSGAKYCGEEIIPMAITLFARDIDANVQDNRMSYWLFTTLHEFAHIYRRRQRPEVVSSDNEEDECDRIAHDTLQVYKKQTPKN